MPPCTRQVRGVLHYCADEPGASARAHGRPRQLRVTGISSRFARGDPNSVYIVFSAWPDGPHPEAGINSYPGRRGGNEAALITCRPVLLRTSPRRRQAAGRIGRACPRRCSPLAPAPERNPCHSEGRNNEHESESCAPEGGMQCVVWSVSGVRTGVAGACGGQRRGL